MFRFNFEPDPLQIDWFVSKIYSILKYTLLPQKFVVFFRTGRDSREKRGYVRWGDVGITQFGGICVPGLRNICYFWNDMRHMAYIWKLNEKPRQTFWSKNDRFRKTIS